MRTDPSSGLRGSGRDLRFREALCLDENHQALGHHAVMRHGLGSRPGLHRAHDGVHVGNVHEHRNSDRVLRVDERPDVGDAEGAKELFALRRGEPMILDAALAWVGESIGLRGSDVR